MYHLRPNITLLLAYCDHLSQIRNPTQCSAVYNTYFLIQVSASRLGGLYSDCTYEKYNPLLNVYEEYYNVKYSAAVSRFLL